MGYSIIAQNYIYSSRFSVFFKNFYLRYAMKTGVALFRLTGSATLPASRSRGPLRLSSQQIDLLRHPLVRRGATVM